MPLSFQTVDKQTDTGRVADTTDHHSHVSAAATWLTSKDEGKISGAIYELTQSILSQQSRHLDALKMKELRKILRVSWTAKKTIEWVLNKAGVQRTEINGESTFTVWPTFRSRTAEEQNRTDIRQVISCTATYRPLCAASLLLLSNITYQ